MRVSCFIFAFLFLFFQVQASLRSQDEAIHENVGQVVKTAFEDGEGDELLQRSNPVNNAQRCKEYSGLCRYGMCPWNENKVGNCAFARPCCKRNHL